MSNLAPMTDPAEGPIIFVYGNCQAQKMTEALALSPEIAGEAELFYVNNFTDHDRNSKAVVQQRADYLKANAHRARAVVYQTEFWDPQATSTLQALPERCRRLPIPALRNTIFWPYCFKDKISRRARPPRRMFPYGDTQLHKAVLAGGEPSEVVAQHMATDLNTTLPFERWRDRNLDMLRQLEAQTAIRVVEWIADEFSEREFFTSPNHPVNDLLRRIVDQTLTGLGYAPLTAEAGAAFEAGPSIGEDLHLPIHPSFAEAAKVSYHPPGKAYRYEGELITYETWALDYARTVRDLATPAEMAG